VDDLEAIAEAIRARLVTKNAAREAALTMSRELVRHCAHSIRAVHRGEFAAADQLLATAWGLVQQLAGDLSPHPDVYSAGYVQDALKEFAEARLVYALVRGEPLPDPASLRLSDAAYLNGLGEATGELRRYILDALRRGQPERSEEILQAMDDVYGVLVTMDFPDAITGNLRRTTDVVRGIMEKTRGDLTYALRQQELEAALHNLEDKLT
jgi:translin